MDPTQFRDPVKERQIQIDMVKLKKSLEQPSTAQSIFDNTAAIESDSNSRTQFDLVAATQVVPRFHEFLKRPSLELTRIDHHYVLGVADDQELRFLINNQISKTFEDTGRSACMSTDLIKYLKSKELS